MGVSSRLAAQPPSSAMERAVQVFAIIHLGIMGLSHVVAPRAWAEFFIWLRGKGHAGVFVVGFMSLGFGSIVVAFHNVWSGIPMVLTILGWAQVFKALIYFTIPGYGLRKLEFVTMERYRMFIVPGALLVAIAGLLVYHVASG